VIVFVLFLRSILQFWYYNGGAHLGVVTQYEERVRRMQKAPRFSYGRQMVRADGGPNRLFFCNQFNDHAMAIEFPNDISLLRRTVQCHSCRRDMTWSKCSNIHDGFLWQCQRRVAGARCNQSASMRHGSWFQQSKLALQEIILLTYDIVCCVCDHL